MRERFVIAIMLVPCTLPLYFATRCHPWLIQVVLGSMLGIILGQVAREWQYRTGQFDA